MSQAETERCSQRADARSSHHGSAVTLLNETKPADLVVASYAAGEIAEGKLPRFAQLLWAATAGALVIIEPGTPTGYGRILRVRSELIAAGARVAAPCPHERECPLHPPDWCHFAQRLPRSRDHLHIK